MALSPDQTLAHYRLVAKIGEGGMGEVWRARDTALERDVAIKVLPELFASDPERLARFEREAKVLASLNHPCIAQIYGLHAAEGVRFLAMELVPGEDLARRLSQGPLPMEEAVLVALQVAGALEAAHESGVIHRDLKPANVVLAAEGGAKVLDFGLAKIFDPEASAADADLSLSPTLTAAGTQAGVVLGTASYMSPEQARGRRVDRRGDIWAFGCLLYEALTGTRLFRGETISDTIAFILQREPDWSSLPSATPARLRELLQRCLEKDPRQRLRDIGDARLELEQVRQAREWTGPVPVGIPEGTAGAVRSGRGPALAAALLAGALLGAGLVWAWLPRAGAELPPMRLSVAAPEGILPSTPVLSPDGRTLVFAGIAARTGAGSPEPSRLYVRPLDRAEATPLGGTEGAALPAISTDGRWLAYRAPLRPGAPQQRVFRAPLDGSAPPLALADWSDDWSEALLWGPGDEILVTSRRPLALVRLAGDGSGPGAPLPLQTSEAIPEIVLADLLPDGIHLLATSYSWEGPGYHDLTHVVDSRSGTVRTLLENGSNPEWSPSGHLLFTRLDTLLAVPFDLEAVAIAGPPVTVADDLRTRPADAGAFFDLSATGTLVHQSGGRIGSRRRLVVLEDSGEVRSWSADRLSFQEALVVAQDGGHLATTVMKPDDLLFSVWVSEVDRPRLRQWASMPGLDCNEPAWHPDSRHLLYNCEGAVEGAGVYMAPLDGGEAPRLLWRAARAGPFSSLRGVHPGGRFAIIDVDQADGTVAIRVPLDAPAGAPAEGVPLVPSRRRTRGATFSPDGRWIAYFSDDSGRNELFLASFSPDGTVGHPTLVEATPLSVARWLPAGTAGAFDLAFLVAAGKADRVRVRTAGGLSISDPVTLLDVTGIRPPILTVGWQPDGRHLAIQEEEERPSARRLDLVFRTEVDLHRLAGR